MSAAKKIAFKQRMQALHDKYCRQLPEKYNEIQISWEQCRGDLAKEEFIETFYRLIHTLKGTAATFGFKTQADICYKIQKILLKEKENHSTLAENNIEKIQAHLNELKENITVPAEHFPD